MKLPALFTASALFAIAGLPSAAMPLQQQAGAAHCTGLLDQGRQHLAAGDLNAAKAAFDAVVIRSCPSDLVAEAYLKRGEIYLLNNDFKQATGELARISESHSRSPAALDAGVIRGRIALAQDRTDLQAVIREFEGVAVAGRMKPEAVYYAALTNQLDQRFTVAMRQFREVELREPRSALAAKALLGLAHEYLRLRQHDAALHALQLVQERFPGSTQAETALNWSTIVYRLYLRVVAGAGAFEYSGMMGSGRSISSDGVDILVGTSRPIVVVAHRSGWSVLDPNGQEAIVNKSREEDFDVSAVALGRGEQIAVAKLSSIELEGREPTSFAPHLPGPSREQRPLKIRAMAYNWRGDWIFADEETDSLQRLTPGTSEVVAFSPLSAAALAINELDCIYATIPNQKIAVLDRQGVGLHEIPRQGGRPDGRGSYEFGSVQDIALDQLGHLYVLDGDQRAIHVFGPSFDYITSYGAASGDGRLRDPVALAVDASGRLYVLDNGPKRVLIYR